MVAFLDLDQELLAPRYRAAEEALGAAGAGRPPAWGGAPAGGRLLLQTRQPRHEVVQAALMADPARVSGAEAERRRELGYPPATAMAVVSGPSAERWMEGFGGPSGVEVLGPSDGQWLLRAPDHEALCDRHGHRRPAPRARPARGRPPPPLTPLRSGGGGGGDPLPSRSCRAFPSPVTEKRDKNGR